MVFPERIISIKTNDLVLEVGPGSNPHHRSNIFLDKRFDDPRIADAQRGYEPLVGNGSKKTVYYSGGKFPFKDKRFDYVICSHVIEHVEASEFHTFVSELSRVAKRGYLEFPTVFYELINYEPVHRWFMNSRDDCIYMLDKSQFKSNVVHRVYKEMFYGADTYCRDMFLRYKELFFTGFEWEKGFKYIQVGCFDELVNDVDCAKWKRYFSEVPMKMKKPRRSVGKFLMSLPRRIVGKTVGYMRPGKPYFVHKTARLDNSSLISIGDHAEIKDYVIIQTHSNKVSIGEYTQINPFTVIYGDGGVEIGDNVLIAPHCMLAAGNHDFKQTKKPIRFADNLSKGPIVIEDNVWIGANSTILDGVKIGRDAVVGANSVVTGNVNPYDIVAGVPAKTIGNRKSREAGTT